MLPLLVILTVVGVGIAEALAFTFGWPGFVTGLAGFIAIVGYYRKDLFRK